MANVGVTLMQRESPFASPVAIKAMVGRARVTTTSCNTSMISRGMLNQGLSLAIDG